MLRRIAWRIDAQTSRNCGTIVPCDARRGEMAHREGL
jgi:hypothetical protein